MKGDKVVAFCDGRRPTFGHRNCNIISPFVSAPGNRNESPLFKTALTQVMSTARTVGIDLIGTVVSLDGVYDSRENRKAIFNRGMVPNINKIYVGERRQSQVQKAVRFIHLPRKIQYH
ncbi:hypothetical protein [Acaryochloris sp. CCMEE 5410]|uniref:hypothetical protein n=1 Tax=Acaryochloris sp. CCMEE 5410 TaxID=310037 RepID=UPI0021D0A106|nr:hypothetical protein [Acaryochloris sp. CCMEE 5410]